jgi:hypothetical protein
LAAAALAAGCTSSPEIATLQTGGPPSPTAEEPSPDETARDMAACLTAAGVAATAEPVDGEGTSLAVQIGGDQMSLANYGGGQAMLSAAKGDAEPIDEAAFFALAAQYDPAYADTPAAPATEDGDMPLVSEAEPYLIVGATDHTPDFVKCLEETGYTEPEFVPDADEELAEKQAALDVTLAWADCAREHGFTQVKDPRPPVADRHMTMPTALLPADLTVPELTALLEDCPNFDPAPFEARDVAEAELGADATEDEISELYATFPIPQPQIGFDVRGFDGDWSVPPDPETDAKLRPLLDLLARRSMEYWAEKEGRPVGPGVG